MKEFKKEEQVKIYNNKTDGREFLEKVKCNRSDECKTIYDCEHAQPHEKCDGCDNPRCPDVKGYVKCIDVL